MDLAKYCKDKGMSLAQYKQFKSNIEVTAQALTTIARSKTNLIYHDISDLFPVETAENREMKFILISELKKLGIEFADNYTCYRG